MKLPLPLISGLLAVLSITASCRKDDAASSAPAPRPPASAWGREEYFWARSWHWTIDAYELTVQPARLTQAAIDKGIKVHVAIWTEMTTFEELPATYYDNVRKANVLLSYEATPGQLRIIAKAPFSLDYVSDVFVAYKLN